jgi:hypothetical protein
MDLSFIIVNWNAKKYLLQCIGSIIDSHPSFSYEIIVVDNASSDGSPEMVKGQFPDVLVVCNNNNLGFARANNIGIRKAQGKFLCLVNSDVVVSKGCLEKMIAFMQSQPLIGMMGPQVIGINGAVQRSCMKHPTLLNMFARAIALDSIFPKLTLMGNQLMTNWKHDILRRVDIINGCFWLIRRQALEGVGLLDEQFFMYGEDMDWCKRFWDAHWEIVFYPDAQVVHYGGASSANSPIKFYVEMHRASLKYWNKHHGKVSSLIYRLVLLLHHCFRAIAYLLQALLVPGKSAKGLFKVHRSIACGAFLLNIPFFNQVTDAHLATKRTKSPNV